MTTILIARHGNTFDSGDKVVRVGLNSNLPLSKSGERQAQKLGVYFKANQIPINAVFTSCLDRTIQTATIALEAAELVIPTEQNMIFNEIDYGPDEGKTEQELIARIGLQALKDWDSQAIAPKGWVVEPTLIIKNWLNFANMVEQQHQSQTILIVTSNGIARFAPYITDDFISFSSNNKIKLATGSISSISNRGKGWKIDYWNKNI